MIVLIPAYEPGDRLHSLIRGLLARDADLQVLVVDDGSGPRFARVFAEAATAGATVLHHSANLGKGAALKTGIRHVLDEWPGEDVVTADADGQHTPDDIVRIADGLRQDAAVGRAALILGCRDFAGDVPLRSRIGNTVARALFRVAAGWPASDTQTGLRGIPAVMLAWAADVAGDRFEYEIEMLLRLRRAGFEAREISIETVYLEQNASSHFRPIADSLRVTLPLVLFAGSSLFAFAIDTLALLLFTWATGWLVGSIVAARVVSASVNFAVNRRIVFARRGRAHAVRHAVRYALLAVALLASNVVWMQALTGFGMPLVLAKVITEVVLFITSYQVQRGFLFGAADAEAGGAAGRAALHPVAYETDAGSFIAAEAGHSDRIAARRAMEQDTNPLERTP